MTPVAAAILALLPCIYWTQPIDSRAVLESAGIARLCVAPDQEAVWKAAGFAVTPIAVEDLGAREALLAPGVAPRPGVASPTRSPWINANGWRFIRKPQAKYVYEVPAGKGALAAAEAFAYRADAVLKIEAADVAATGAMLRFLSSLDTIDLPGIADIAVIDDGTPITGEVMNLLSRRNLLFQAVPKATPEWRIAIAVGSPQYPAEEAANPSAFAQKIRRELTDERRALRVYGSEVVLCRVTGDGTRARLHVLNYGGRDIEGLRIKLRGTYAAGTATVFGAGRLPLDELVAGDGATEFSVPRLTAYAVIDLQAAK
jgi:hypothetical protein